MWALPGAAVPSENVHLRQHEPSTACRESLLCHGAPCPPPAPLFSMLPSFILSFFLFPPLLPVQFLPFLKHVFPEVPLTGPQGLALPCGGSAGAGWNRLGAAPASPHRRRPAAPGHPHQVLQDQCELSCLSFKKKSTQSRQQKNPRRITMVWYKSHFQKRSSVQMEKPKISFLE